MFPILGESQCAGSSCAVFSGSHFQAKGEARVPASEHRHIKFYGEIRLAFVGFMLAFGLNAPNAIKRLQLTGSSGHISKRLLDILCCPMIGGTEFLGNAFTRLELNCKG